MKIFIENGWYLKEFSGVWSDNFQIIRIEDGSVEVGFSNGTAIVYDRYNCIIQHNRSLVTYLGPLE